MVKWLQLGPLHSRTPTHCQVLHGESWSVIIVQTLLFPSSITLKYHSSHHQVNCPTPQFEPTNHTTNKFTQRHVLTSSHANNFALNLPNGRNMQTRSKINIFKPTASQALKLPEWRHAMNDECKAYWFVMKHEILYHQIHFIILLVANGYFASIATPMAVLIITKPVWLLKGFHQWPEIDYHETFSLVSKLATVCLVINLALLKRWPLRQLDVNNAFLHGTSKNDGFMTQSTPCVWPKKALYDLKQASRGV